MKAIEKALTDYIQFGRENGNQITDNECALIKDLDIHHEINIYEIITSKGHIEAVARGIRKIDVPEKQDLGIFNNLYELEGYIKNITILQAIAIRDGKLERFINNIIKND